MVFSVNPVTPAVVLLKGVTLKHKRFTSTCYYHSVRHGSIDQWMLILSLILKEYGCTLVFSAGAVYLNK